MRDNSHLGNLKTEGDLQSEGQPALDSLRVDKGSLAGQPHSARGYTLPVFAVAAAQAALLHLHHSTTTLREVSIKIQTTPNSTFDQGADDQGVEIAQILVEQVAQLDPSTALAICRSDPGENLDLTRHTPVWAWVQLQPRDNTGQLILELQGGEGIGKTENGDPAIYRYARELFDHNLTDFIPPGSRVVVRIILPEGKQLAQRTSNAAFGVLEGLALLGTRGVVEPHSAVASLETSRTAIRQMAEQIQSLTLCIGSHGQQVATRLRIPASEQVVAGNWIGALMLEAALHGISQVTLLGYHGKLIKLAGGIFNTSSHLADGRLEIFSAAVIRAGGSLDLAQAVLGAATVDAANQLLEDPGFRQAVWSDIIHHIQKRSARFVQKYAERDLKIGVILFDRAGVIVAQSDAVE